MCAEGALTTVTSLTLLAGLRDQGNAAAWQRFADRYRPMVVSFAAKLGLSESDLRDYRSEHPIPLGGILAGEMYVGNAPISPRMLSFDRDRSALVPMPLISAHGAREPQFGERVLPCFGLVRS